MHQVLTDSAVAGTPNNDDSMATNGPNNVDANVLNTHYLNQTDQSDYIATKPTDNTAVLQLMQTTKQATQFLTNTITLN